MSDTELLKWIVLTVRSGASLVSAEGDLFLIGAGGETRAIGSTVTALYEDFITREDPNDRPWR